MPAPDHSPHQTPKGDATWLRAFHAGDRACMTECYQEHFDVVAQAVGAVLSGSDRETVVQEVFFRLLTDPLLRAAFQGGSLAGWLRVVARNQAIDQIRRRRLEVLVPDATAVIDATACVEDDPEQTLHVRLTLQRFRAQVLPAKWEAVFLARFVQQQDQPTAARALRMRRTTLAYQEYRIRNLLRRFVLKGERA
jgi:RNA polymerase sigma-70 factor, ECF subfamily